MGCEQYKPRLSSYVDAELAPQEIGDVEHHLQGCASCSAQVQAQTRLKREIRLSGMRYAPSLEFRRRVEAQIAPPRHSKWFAGWIPRLALASLVLIAAIAGWNQRERRADPILAELVDVHVATLASANPIDVVSTDRHTVKPWFQGKVPFTFNLPELNNSGFTLLGGRVSYLQQQPTAQLLFEIRKHRISVFVRQDQSSVHLSAGESSAFIIRSWKNAGLEYFMVTDASRQDADALVGLFKGTS